MHWIDPASLPAVQGTIACYTRNAAGDVDGVLLSDDRQVHVPPHLGAAVEKLFAVGDTIEARGVRPRGGDVFAAVSVTAQSGRSIVDEGPPHGHGPHGPHHAERAKRKGAAPKPVVVDGRVRRTLYAPKGEVAGAVLESGQQLRVDAKANAALSDYFAAGAEVRVWGRAREFDGTTVVDVDEVGFRKDFE